MNYTELQAKVAKWMLRGDLSSIIPDFIQLAEARLNRNLRLSSMDTVTDIVLSGSTVAIPDDCAELLGVSIVFDGNEYPLTKVSYEKLGKTDDVNTPSAYSVTSEIIFNRNGPGCTARVRYLKGLDLATDTENWLSVNYPDIYLFASLVEGAAYAKQSMDVIAGWSQRLETAISELNHKEARSKVGQRTTDLGWVK